ncbi:unnamed protein product [Adineta steineri]|uniref:Ketosynthase family 3 (KS3) domain-containing protein n=1 Tax=Adineta steineri TaxID=433720 RepID=A0A815MPP6_9BILA|nr:unnamed protein product [Adineta steineri]CAF1622598.1 unnamed protein product [Adineta steineri]
MTTTRMRPEHGSRFHEPNTLLYNTSARLSYHDAERDDDRIYCGIRDVLSGHDGNEDKLNFFVPSAAGQGRLLENIYSRNNSDTQKLLFVEVHDTGTPVGDPIEANCLGRFVNRSTLNSPLLLGSIKSNLGHSEGANGVASLIKAAMCIYHRGITANMQFTSLNPKIEAQNIIYIFFKILYHFQLFQIMKK